MTSNSAVIWVPSVTEAWVPGQIVGQTSTNLLVVIKNAAGSMENLNLPTPLSNYDLVTPGSLEQICPNLVDLESYSEGIILHHIKTRFKENIIYTFVGNILVAVNPYKNLDIYGQSVMDDIYTQLRKAGTIGNLQPHVYTIAAIALNGMRDENKDQCVLISGESGAGKHFPLFPNFFNFHYY